MRKEVRKRLAGEYRYALAKMKDSAPLRKLFYFSIVFAEAHRVSEWEWDGDVALIDLLGQQTHMQATTALQNPILPVDPQETFEKLAAIMDELATYLEKPEEDPIAFHKILVHFAEVINMLSGHGSYLHEKKHS